MEKFLHCCLDSVTQQDVPNSLEIIVVNDGSTDCSLSIINEYAQKNPYNITVINKPNGHYGSCINAALKIATGKYFRILDADDWIDTNNLIQFLKKIESVNVDLIITPRTEFKGDLKKTYALKNTPSIILSKDEFQNIPYDELDGILSMHSMTYSLSFLRKNKLKLQEGICYTDTEYYLHPLDKINNFLYLDYNLYQYRLGREGQSMDLEVQKANRHQMFMILSRILDELFPQKNKIVYKRIQTLLQVYFGMLLFNVPLTKDDQQDMLILYNKMQSTEAPIWKSLNKSLFYIPYLWKITGKNMYLYTKFKNFLGVRNIFLKVHD
jgi:glycosyltransferase involved in cell wall biosynthesis